VAQSKALDNVVELTPTHIHQQITAALGVSPHRFVRDVDSWLEEDFGGGDCSVWTQSCINRRMKFKIVAKQDFLLCGLNFAAAVVHRTHSAVPVTVSSAFADGQQIVRGDVILQGEGDANALLLAERVALNLMARLSGISTKTAHMQNLILQASSGMKDNPPVLLETRKTTPGLRIYEKYATRIGGARNHRHALDTGLMLKENHLRAFGGIERALDRCKTRSSVLTRTEVEVTNLSEFRQALQGGADVIMLDNFSQSDVHEAVTERNASGRNIALELSGNLTEVNIAMATQLGVDYMSSGALIHQATWVDLSMQLYSLE
jgi:nicotinate-nucleotide pyrophosphorylase (carboxylating)